MIVDTEIVSVHPAYDFYPFDVVTDGSVLR